MSPAATPTLRQRELAARLRKLRQDSGMTVAEVAERLLISQTKLSRIETGTRSAQLRDVRDLCELYRVKAPVLDELMALARQARERGWWQSYDLFSEADVYAGLEASAVSLHSFENAILPGLVQTQDYAEGVARALAPMFPGIQVDQLVAVRMERQQRLIGAGGPEIWLVCDEAALLRQVGSPDLMARQIQRLLDLMDAPNLTFQILPFDAGATLGAQSNFMILGLPDVASDVVYSEGLVGFHFLEKPEELRRYRAAFDHLRAAAEGPARTRDRLLRMLPD